MREMKDSGVEWIGEIPQEWSLKRLRFLCNITTGNMDTQDNDPEGQYPFYVRSPIVEHSNNYTFDNEAVLMAGDGVGAGKVFHYVNGKYGCHQRVYSMSDFNEVVGKYLYYYLQENFYKKIEESNAKSTVDSVRLPMLKDFPVVFPDVYQQKEIVSYLNSKCANIDEVIKKQQAIIEKLKEYKLSVINEALTHGLEETRNYKESGTDWIGKIPEHWSIQKLKTIVDILPGYAFSSNDFATDEGIPLLRGINVVPSGIRWNDVVFWNQEVPKYLEPYYLQENDIVVGLDRPWISDGMRTTIMNKDSLPCLLLQRVCRIRLKKECAYDHRLIYHWINSKAFESALSIETTGVSVPHISTKQIENFIIALPPNEEARSICDYLHVKTCEIDKSISIRSQLIGKLLDYKKSLIYEVVTGKREV